jgi:hypothetical protein
VQKEEQEPKFTTFVRESPLPRTSSAPGTSSLPLAQDKVVSFTCCFRSVFFFLFVQLSNNYLGKDKETFDLVDELMQGTAQPTKDELKALKAPVSGNVKTKPTK